ncbi:MAG: glycosyltransferase family 4 protein [Candidatus Zixiibacteriota bacterium]
MTTTTKNTRSVHQAHSFNGDGIFLPSVLFEQSNIADTDGEPRVIALIKQFLKELGWSVGTFRDDHGNGLQPRSLSATSGVVNFLVHQASFVREFRRELPGYNAVHLFTQSAVSFFRWTAPAILLARFYGKRILLSYQRNEVEIELERAGRWIVPLLRLCDKVYVPSDYQAGVLARRGIQAEVVPYAVDRDLFQARAIRSVQPRLIMTRSHQRRNNISCALEAYKLVKQKYPRAEMVIAGDGPLRQEIETLAVKHRLNGVTFTGEVSQKQLVQLLADADIYVNCSTIDGLPVSLLEALAVGLPIVTTNVGGIPEIITNDVNGLFVRPNDPAGLANRIIQLIETPDLVEKLSEQAKLSIMPYSWPQVKKKWIHPYVHLGRP